MPPFAASEAAGDRPSWSESITGRPTGAQRETGLIGILPGEGVGPEVIAAAQSVLASVTEATGLRVSTREGPEIGLEAELQTGDPLSQQAFSFCRSLFEEGGALLCGPARGRFVYELRRRFELFCKLSPLAPDRALLGAIHLKPEYLEAVDVLVVREGCAGVYQGTWSEDGPEGRRRASQAFSYSEPQVRQILDAAARLASRRRGEIAVVVKAEGTPSISNMWRRHATEVADRAGIGCSCVDVDLAAYRLLQEPQAFDVVVAPNLFGDVLSDAGAVLLGSRGLSFGGSFSASGAAVYQTNHGAAMDLAGSDTANPGGQLLSLAMLLRESFGRHREAGLVETALSEVWRQGWRTADLAEPGSRVVGTQEIAGLVAEAIAQRSRVASR
jgi:3-isopropylmalate dehydrogenase